MKPPRCPRARGACVFNGGACSYCGRPEPPDLFNRPPAGKRATSAAAARGAAGTAATTRRQVLEVIEAAGGFGLTDEEGAAALGMSGNTYRPRRLELAKAGRIRDSGRTRATVTGHKAVVWTA